MSLLHSEIQNLGFRYFNLGVPPPPALVPPGRIPLPSVTIPHLSWVREVTAELLKAVEPHMPNNVAAGVAKGTFIFPKPVPKGA